jgi:hypothetical protein
VKKRDLIRRRWLQICSHNRFPDDTRQRTYRSLFRLPADTPYFKAIERYRSW